MPEMPSATRFTRAAFWLMPNTQAFESPLNKATQRVELPGQTWRASFTLPQMRRMQASAWIGFFMSLKGRVNSFTCSDPDWQYNLGPWTGAPLVNGAGQTGNSLNIDGCTASVTGWGRAGDYFNLASKLYRLTADCNTNASNQTTLVFEPPIYNAPADDLALTFNPATVSMRLMDDAGSQWPVDAQGNYESKTFEAVEDL